MGHVVRDSAGITIVESGAAVWRGGEGWRLSESPIVRIGAVEGDPEYLLLGLRSALRLDDGTIVVSNTGTEELRWYDARGRFLMRAGGEGEGPGEFSQLLWIWSLGPDSIIAYDDRQHRVSVFHRDGTFCRSARLEPPAGVVRGVFADGSIFLAEHVIWSGPREGRIRPPARAYRLERDGAVLDSLPTFAGPEFRFEVRGRDGYGSIAISPPPFGRRTVFAVSGDGFYTGNQDEHELGYYDERGTLKTLLRWSGAERRVTPAHIDAHERHELDEIENEDLKRRVEERQRTESYPELLPAFGAVAMDADGNLWVEEYHFDWADVRRWMVFDSELRLLGTVEMPGEFIVHQIGSDFVLGYSWDELDVEYIELYELLKP